MKSSHPLYQLGPFLFPKIAEQFWVCIANVLEVCICQSELPFCKNALIDCGPQGA